MNFLEINNYPVPACDVLLGMGVASLLGRRTFLMAQKERRN
jgi:hypothetical protein